MNRSRNVDGFSGGNGGRWFCIPVADPSGRYGSWKGNLDMADTATALVALAAGSMCKMCALEDAYMADAVAQGSDGTDAEADARSKLEEGLEADRHSQYAGGKVGNDKAARPMVVDETGDLLGVAVEEHPVLAEALHLLGPEP